ncbi:hypothetical protein ACJIZ3_023292 [Penstemon smallii]|uniref:Uncharacterized protein n=1 Tax=Penstemon smallii TaxID=265156 RepID=A0ABD3TNP4_9LAMI
MAQSEIKIESFAQETAFAEDYEGMPLKQRLKLLLASRRISFDVDLKSEIELGIPAIAVDGVVEKRGNEGSHSQSCYSAEEKMTDTVSRLERSAGKPVECNNHDNVDSSLAAATTSGVDSVDKCSVHWSLAFKHPVKLKVEPADNGVESQSTGCMKDSSGAGIQTVNIEPEVNVGYLDELDHVLLKERLRTLLKSKSMGLQATMLEVNFSGITRSVSAPSRPQAAGTGKGLKFGDQRLSVCGNQINEVDRTLKSGSSKRNVSSSCNTPQALRRYSGGSRSTAAGDSRVVHKNDRAHSSENVCSKYESTGRQALPYGDTKTVQHAAIPNLTKIKAEPPNNYEFPSSILNLTAIKVEPPNNYEFQSLNATKASQMYSENLVLAKTEVEFHGDSHEDMLDHMLLRQRMKLLSSRYDPSLKVRVTSECMRKTLPSTLDCRPVESRPAQSLKVNRPRKRRKTATDSVETAMEEDAPGLLQVLIEKGVAVNEIKLYGEPESNDALDDSPSEDNFAELESVIGKLFSQREPMLKLGSLRCNKGEKATYCLECLFSLVEQARYLQFRSWPVEWGWCRDLQSFIFVFERHNRIVLERPEYGYATYFFELADALPIGWQIRRLVTAMKLTSCSRITLIENKALMVGDDLTEGEAKVLMEYGWIPNTGIGTMLNYYDRVVHDRRNEKDSSEWKSKIGKLLMEGYNGGTIISAVIPSKVMEYNIANPQQVKMELS